MKSIKSNRDLEHNTRVSNRKHRKRLYAFSFLCGGFLVVGVFSVCAVLETRKLMLKTLS